MGIKYLSNSYDLGDLDGMTRDEVDGVTDEDDVCSECGASLDDGEGFNGLCGNCADAAEQHSCENCGFTYSTGEGGDPVCCEAPIDAGW